MGVSLCSSEHPLPPNSLCSAAQNSEDLPPGDGPTSSSYSSQADGLKACSIRSGLVTLPTWPYPGAIQDHLALSSPLEHPPGWRSLPRPWLMTKVEQMLLLTRLPVNKKTKTFPSVALCKELGTYLLTNSFTSNFTFIFLRHYFHVYLDYIKHILICI